MGVKHRVSSLGGLETSAVQHMAPALIWGVGSSREVVVQTPGLFAPC